MKKVVSLFVVQICLFLGGCHTEHKDGLYGMSELNSQQTSQILVSVSNAGLSAMGQLVFSGDDILWYNETTKELRYKDNGSKKSMIINNKEISFFMSNQYLFSSLIYTSADSFQIINSLVLYYNLTENKYFLLDGYPDIAILQELNALYQQNSLDDYNFNIPVNGQDMIPSMPQYAQELRIENRQKIAAEWGKFIDQLKKEGRYIK